MNAIALYLFIDLFVALPLAYVLLLAKHEDGEQLHPIWTILLCALWPVFLSVFGVACLLAPGWADEHERRRAERANHER